MRVCSLQKTPQKPRTAPATFSSAVRMGTASPTGGNVTERMTAGTGLMRRIVEVRAQGSRSALLVCRLAVSREPGSVCTVLAFCEGGTMLSVSGHHPLHLLSVLYVAYRGQRSTSGFTFRCFPPWFLRLSLTGGPGAHQLS